MYFKLTETVFRSDVAVLRVEDVLERELEAPETLPHTGEQKY